ncbi:M4 family peptidase [Cryobacterium adonitolivorans]|uniref:Neutral metalloproteinase n=1 Tax=Cryobacterium adonitolivorans TaxID=1259189 RepID=A0A4R8WA63_9MICO|nr:M4 family metallopeptidase [Cryobacterium adonitolivorans]TFC03524.1 M4 family peptidase [Cryobacterium adonitolivorans]
MTGTDQTQSPVPFPVLPHSHPHGHPHGRGQFTQPFRCSVVPPYLLEHLAAVDDPRFEAAAEAARRSLRVDDPIRSLRFERRTSALPTLPVQAVPGITARTISDAGQLQRLPGRTVRTEGHPPVADEAVNEAYTGLGDTHGLFWSRYQRDSIDGRGLPLDATVHYGRNYDNAFWDGERMVFGDGDGEVFNRFTISLSVIAHELTHGVTQYSANLAYQGQSGALNESVSDVFGALVEQYAAGQDTQSASWLIGAGLFTDQVQGQALRSMKAPGTAYDDDVLGADPQPASMDGYIETEDDYGGVHLNSGIPNRAFYLVAEALGGNAWEAPGQIWYDTLTGPNLTANADFAAFAAATATAATTRYGVGSAEHDAVLAGWDGVGLAFDPLLAAS